MNPILLYTLKERTFDEKGKKVKRQVSTRNLLIMASQKMLQQRAASAFAGITQKTLSNWLRAGEANLHDHENYDVPLGELGMFYRDWVQAWGQQYYQLQDSILKVAKGEETNANWIAAQTAMERFNPDEAGQRKALSLEGEATITVEHRKVTGEEWRQQRSIQKFDDSIETNFTDKSLQAEIERELLSQ
jgi:hypothetical protein